MSAAVIIVPDTFIDLAGVWYPGNLYELSADVSGVMCDDPAIAAVSAILKCSMVAEQTFASDTNGQLRVVLRATKKVGHLALAGRVADGPVVAIFLPLSIDRVRRHMLQLSGQWVPKFRMIKIVDWATANVYARDASLVSCGYFALARTLGHEPIDRAELADYLLDRYLIDRFPSLLLLDKRFNPVNKVVLSTVNDLTRVPPGIAAALRAATDLPEVNIVHSNGDLYVNPSVPRGPPPCIAKYKPRSAKHEVHDYCVVVYPALRDASGHAEGEECSHCRESSFPLLTHDMLVKCVDCDQTFRSYVRAKHHHAQAHSLKVRATE